MWVFYNTNYKQEIFIKCKKQMRKYSLEHHATATLQQKAAKINCLRQMSAI